MGREMNNPILRQLAARAQALHLLLCGTGTEADFAPLRIEIPGDRAKFVSGLGQRHQRANLRNLCQSVARLHRCYPAVQPKRGHCRLRGQRAAMLVVASELRQLLIVGVELRLIWRAIK